MKTLLLFIMMAIQVSSFAKTSFFTSYFHIRPTISNNTTYYNNDYNDDYECYPMNNRKFRYAVRAIKRKTFSDTQLRMAKQITGSNCLTAGQIGKIASIFTFESTKLEFVKFAYDYCYDPENYWLVNDVFTFSSSTDELDDYLYGM